MQYGPLFPPQHLVILKTTMAHQRTYTTNRRGMQSPGLFRVGKNNHIKKGWSRSTINQSTYVILCARLDLLYQIGSSLENIWTQKKAPIRILSKKKSIEKEY